MSRVEDNHSNATASINPFSMLRELRALPEPIRPLQFNSLITGAQYFPIYDLTRKHARPGMKALDWGCGNGHFSYFLLRLGLNVQGFTLEPASNPLKAYLMDRFGPCYDMTVGDPANPVQLPYSDFSFDLVFSIGVLEHVRETGGSESSSLSEIVRVLKPGGHFVCGMLPKKYSWIEFLVRHAFKGKHQHAYRYTKQDINNMARHAGLDLITTGTHGFLPRNSWNHPWLQSAGNQQHLTSMFNRIDRAMAWSVRPIAQNFMFSARKPL